MVVVTAAVAVAQWPVAAAALQHRSAVVVRSVNVAQAARPSAAVSLPPAAELQLLLAAQLLPQLAAQLLAVVAPLLLLLAAIARRLWLPQLLRLLPHQLLLLPPLLRLLPSSLGCSFAPRGKPYG